MLTDKRERIVALDLLRGYFLVVILIDHLGMFPNPFELLTGRGNLWASAAEGFFLISGLLVGYIYTPRLVRSFKTAAAKIWRRAGVLYLWSVGLTTLFTLWGQFAVPASKAGSLWQDPPIADFLYKTLSLQYSFGWADFLRYYAVFMLVAPFALWLCSRGLAWLVLGVSATIWLLTNSEYFLSWQLLFTIGIVAGYYLPQLRSVFNALGRSRQRQIVMSVLGLSLLTVLASAILNRLTVFMIETYSGFTALPAGLQQLFLSLNDWRQSLIPWTKKEDLGALRLLIALLWFSALYILFRRYEKPIDNYTRGVLRAFGEKSLQVYIIQSLIVFFALTYLGQGHSIIISTLLTVLGIALNYYLIKYLPSLQKISKFRKRTSVD